MLLIIHWMFFEPLPICHTLQPWNFLMTTTDFVDCKSTKGRKENLNYFLYFFLKQAFSYLIIDDRWYERWIWFGNFMSFLLCIQLKFNTSWSSRARFNIRIRNIHTTSTLPNVVVVVVVNVFLHEEMIKNFKHTEKQYKLNVAYKHFDRYIQRSTSFDMWQTVLLHLDHRPKHPIHMIVHGFLNIRLDHVDKRNWCHFSRSKLHFRKQFLLIFFDL